MRKNIKKNLGFTLIELMIVVAIIGILAAVAIPNFLRYQLRAKSAEASVNLAAIKTSQVAYYGYKDSYASADPSPAQGTQAYQNGQKQPFDVSQPGWNDLGWRPEGDVYFSYAAEAQVNRFTADALADLDADGTDQCWMVVMAPVDGSGSASSPVTPRQGCTADNSKVGVVYKAVADAVY